MCLIIKTMIVFLTNQIAKEPETLIRYTIENIMYDRHTITPTNQTMSIGRAI